MSIILVGMARENSTRVQQKMTRPFGDTTLFNLYIDKLKVMSQMDNPFSRVVIGVNKNDKTIYGISKKSGLEVIDRDDMSVSREIHSLNSTHNFLKDIEEDYVMTVNACFPFLKVDTILKIANFFNESKDIKSLTCAKERYNHFWDFTTHKPINNKDPKCVSTRIISPILENVNHILIYKKEAIFKNNSLWQYTKNDPYIYLVEENEECLDIDTPFDFRICEATYKYSKKM
ncbi:MAG: hypothetical protein IMZ52_07990 [Actinobacteria bacterium]|nr:hypothetical protein [Actinomycetota bacterium]MBE3114645.1 hypothetical protein [Actinomycetota bacterium]